MKPTVLFETTKLDKTLMGVHRKEPKEGALGPPAPTGGETGRPWPRRLSRWSAGAESAEEIQLALHFRRNGQWRAQIRL